MPMVLHAPALFKRGEEGRKKEEVLHLSRCYTHTHTHTHAHPAKPGKPWKARGRKERTHDGQTARTAQGGKGTDGPREPTYTAKRTWQKQSPHLNPTTHYGEASGRVIRDQWGLVGEKTETTNKIGTQVLNLEIRAFLPYRDRGQVKPHGHKRLFKFQQIRCTRCSTSPETKVSAPAGKGCLVPVLPWWHVKSLSCRKIGFW